MKPPKVRSSYIERCKNYVQWLGVPMFTVDDNLPDVANGEIDAVESMAVWESRGVSIFMNSDNLDVRCLSLAVKDDFDFDKHEWATCSQPYLFNCLLKGKQCREFNIKQWMSGVKDGEFWPEEFFGCSGLRSAKEFQSIFGRGLILPRLRITLRELDLQIATYEKRLLRSKVNVNA